MKVILVINKPEREKRIMALIRNAIIEIDPDAEVRITTYYEGDFIGNVIRFHPDVVVTYPFTGKGLSRFVYLVKYFTGCTVFTFSTEGFYNVKANDAFIGVDDYCNSLVDFSCYWGQEVANCHGAELIKQGKLRNSEQILVFGYPNYEFYNSHVKQDSVFGTLPTDINDAITKFEKEDIVLIISAFFLADYTEETIRRAGDFDLSGNGLERYLYCSRLIGQFREQFVDAVHEVAQAFPEMLFIVKKHPIEVSFEKEGYTSSYSKLANCSNIVLIGIETTTMHLLPKVGLFCHYGSTVVNESYIFSVPSVYFTFQPYEEVASEFNYFVNDMPYDYTVEIKDIKKALELYVKGKLPFRIDSVKNDYLYQNFNITDIESYRPSMEIAKFIVSGDFMPILIKKNNNFIQKYLREISPKVKFKYRMLGIKNRLSKKINN